MSESDDTDLLLLIPPDFFVIHSDSEDSSEAIQKINNDSRFLELFGEVNELKERINCIESKDYKHATSFSETSPIIQSINNSSFDTFHHINNDKNISLQFYSIDPVSRRVDVHGDREPFSVSSYKSFYPHPVNLCSDSKLEHTANYISQVQSSVNAVSMDVNSLQNLSSSMSSIPVLINTDIPEPCENVYHSQASTNFLREIDAFLESKNSLTREGFNSRSPLNTGTGENGNVNIAKGRDPDNTKSIIIDPSPENVGTDLKCSSYLSFEFDPSSVIDQTKKVKCIQMFNDEWHEDKESTTENSTGAYSSVVQEYKSKTLNKNYLVGDEKLLKERDISGFINVQTKETCFQNRNSFLSSPHCKEDWDTQNFRKVSMHDDKNDSVQYSVEKDSEVRCESKVDFTKNQTNTLMYDCAVSSPTLSQPLLMNRTCNKDNNPCMTRSKDLSQSIDFRLDTNCFSEPKTIRCLSPSNLQNTHTNNSYNLRINDDKVNNVTTPEFRNDERFKLDAFSLNGYPESQRFNRFKHISNSGILIPKNVEEEIPIVQMKKLLKDQSEMNQLTSKIKENVKIQSSDVIDDGYYSSMGTGSNIAHLLSLSDLWGKDGKDMNKREDMTVEQKLEEEYCRRKHCETIIQRLQSTVLEQQQKIAVAVKVDQSKDITIQQLQTAWRRLVTHWQDLEEQRHSISLKLSEEKDKHQQHSIEMMEKVKHCELELSKVLDLAKGYKEKNELLEQELKEHESNFTEEKNRLQMSIQERQKYLLEAEDKLNVMQHQNAELKEKLEDAEKKYFQETQSAIVSQEEKKKLQLMLENLEADVNIIKEENASLRLRLKEERGRNDVLDSQIKNLKMVLNEHKKKDKLQQNEIKEHKSFLEKTKSELREYYQHQVELVVQEKLIEFQTQLDATEASLHQEMEQKEKLAIETASKQIKVITEKNILEVKLLEEKHKEELNLCKLQLTHATHKINQLQAQLQSYSDRKIEIVEKLQTIMETQWQEALRIISGNSPIQDFQDSRRDNVVDIPDNDIKTSSGGNCREVPPLLVRRRSSSSTTDDVPFNQDDQLTFRPKNDQCSNWKNDGYVGNADVVKRYIEVLLNRAPGNPLDQETYFEKTGNSEKAVSKESMLTTWEKLMENQRVENEINESEKFFTPFEDHKFDLAHSSNKCKSSKPPWK